MKELVIIKLKTIIKLIMVFTFGILMAILMRLLYPFIHIRLGILPSSRLGNWAEVSMHFFCSQALELNKKRIDFFFLEDTQPSNNFFLKLIKRELKINRFVQFIYTANSYLPRSSLFYNVNEATLYGDWQKYSRDTDHLRIKTKKVFPFSRDENFNGNHFLTTAGCKDNKRFVCLNIRDSAFLDKLFPGRDNSYHDYRDSDCHSYELAVNELISRGYFVIRMGSAVKEKMNIESDQFLDYPFCSDSSDFLDVWLMANCTFTISTSSGLDSIADIYRKPIAYVNALPLGDFNSSNPRTIWMPKTIVDKTNQPLLLREIIDKEVVSFHQTFALERHHLNVINNTAEEICEVAKEIEEKVSGSWDNSRANVTQRKHVEHLLSTHWGEFSKYHNKAAFEKESFGHFSESFFNKISS